MHFCFALLYVTLTSHYTTPVLMHKFLFFFKENIAHHIKANPEMLKMRGVLVEDQNQGPLNQVLD